MNVNIKKLRHLWYAGPYHIIFVKRRDVGASENWLTFGGSNAFDRKGRKTWNLV